MRLPKLSPPPADQLYRFRSRVSWGVKDTARFDQLMDEASQLVEGGLHQGDNLFAWSRNLSALDDAAFRQAWSANIAAPADEAIMWRRYILCCAAYHCVQLEGDFVECGVFQGTGVKTVIDYFGSEHFGKTFWCYDTFQPGHEGGRTSLAEVQARFAGYGQVRLVAGPLPASLAGNSPERISYLHIDLNHAPSEIAVLDQLFDRVVPGGVVILDDYEWSIYRDQKLNEDPWFEARQYRVFPLPTGQGLVLKRGTAGVLQIDQF